MLNLCLLMFQLSLARYTGEDELSKARMQVLVVLCSKPMQVRLAAFSLQVLYVVVILSLSLVLFSVCFDKVCKILWAEERFVHVQRKDLYICR